MVSRQADHPRWAKVTARLVLTLAAVGTYYLSHGVFGIATAPSVVAAVVLWAPVD